MKAFSLKKEKLLVLSNHRKQKLKRIKLAQANKTGSALKDDEYYREVEQHLDFTYHETEVSYLHLHTFVTNHL